MRNNQSEEKLTAGSRNGRPVFFRVFLVLTLFGVMSFLAMLSSRAWANIRTIDVVRLLGTGLCFGGAIVSFVAYLHSRRST